MSIDHEDFARVDIRVGTVLSAVPNPAARKPAYVLEIDFGPEIGRKTSSAQLTELYAPEQLKGRQVAAVVNFPAKRIAGVRSEVLVLGFPDAAGRVVLVAVDRPVPDGGRLF
jgi:tRNA-binding protein